MSTATVAFVLSSYRFFSHHFYANMLIADISLPVIQTVKKWNVKMISFASVEDAGIQHILFLLLYCYCGSNTQAYWAFLLHVVKTTFQCFIYKRSQQHVLHVRQSLYIDPLLNTTQNGFLSPLGIEPVIFYSLGESCRSLSRCRHTGRVIPTEVRGQ